MAAANCNAREISQPISDEYSDNGGMYSSRKRGCDSSDLVTVECYAKPLWRGERPVDDMTLQFTGGPREPIF